MVRDAGTMKHIHVAQALDCTPATQHTHFTCGLSRGGGLRTSSCRRWSRSLGRVAVVHVQGTPKGDGALGLPRVLSARLRSGASMNDGGER
jgi:hypothetical protein